MIAIIGFFPIAEKSVNCAHQIHELVEQSKWISNDRQADRHLYKAYRLHRDLADLDQIIFISNATRNTSEVWAHTGDKILKKFYFRHRRDLSASEVKKIIYSLRSLSILRNKIIEDYLNVAADKISAADVVMLLKHYNLPTSQSDERRIVDKLALKFSRKRNLALAERQIVRSVVNSFKIQDLILLAE